MRWLAVVDANGGDARKGFGLDASETNSLDGRVRLGWDGECRENEKFAEGVILEIRPS